MGCGAGEFQAAEVDVLNRENGDNFVKGVDFVSMIVDCTFHYICSPSFATVLTWMACVSRKVKKNSSSFRCTDSGRSQTSLFRNGENCVQKVPTGLRVNAQHY